MEVSIKVKTLAIAAAGCAVVVAAAAAAVGWEYGNRSGKRFSRRARKMKAAAAAASAPGSAQSQKQKKKEKKEQDDRHAAEGTARRDGKGKGDPVPDDWGDGSDGVWPERLLRAETVLGCRSDKVILVLEQCVNRQNAAAIYRTAESFGVQEVWEILSTYTKQGSDTDGMKPNDRRVKANDVSKGAEKWLTRRCFPDTAACIRALREEPGKGRTEGSGGDGGGGGGCEIWATDLGPGAQCIHPLAGLVDGGGAATTQGASGNGSNGSDSDGPGVVPLKVPDGRRLAIVMGRELDGVSEQMLAAADKRVYLPMVGFTESFNLSVATALVLQSLFSICPQMRGNICDESKTAIREAWYPKMSDRIKSKSARLRHTPFLALAAAGKLPPPLPDLRRNEKEQQVKKKVVRKNMTSRMNLVGNVEEE